jgi:peptidoglycan/LPS O-acetylase OafA/YrhL
LTATIQALPEIQVASEGTLQPGELISSKAHTSNNFDFLRFVAASSVIWYHTPVFLGRGVDPLGQWTGHLDTGSLAVIFFFVISGFLITQSFDRNNSPRSFIVNRFLRIWPPLVVVLLLCSFVLGPLVTEFSRSQYFCDPHLFSYLQNVFCMQSYNVLPGVFSHNYHREVINGSLWTIPVEVFMYAVTLALGVCGALKNRFALAVGFAALLVYDMQVVSATSIGAQQFLWLPAQLETSKFALMYLMGANYYANRHSIKISWKIALVVGILLIGSYHTPHARLAEVFCLPYLVMFAAYLPVRGLNNFGKYGDFSYGMYLYGFPVQQTLWLATQGHISQFKFTATSLIISFAFAFLSWHLIEKPAMSLKRFLKPKRKLESL